MSYKSISTMSADAWLHAVKDIREVMAKHFPGMEWHIRGGDIPGEGPYWRLQKYYEIGWQLDFKLDEDSLLHDSDFRELDDEEADARMEEVSKRVFELGAGEKG